MIPIKNFRFSRLAEFFPQAPVSKWISINFLLIKEFNTKEICIFQPKISLFSPFERVNDRRTLAERRQLFLGQTLIEEKREAKPKSKFETSATGTNKKLKKKKEVQESGDAQAAEEAKQAEPEENVEPEEAPAPEEEPAAEED